MTALERRFNELERDWLAVTDRVHSDTIRWDRALTDLAREVAALRDAGRWVHGRADFMGILGRHRDELAHSKMVAWLLDPCARHGLGTRFLSRILELAFVADAPTAVLERAVVSSEVPIGDGRLDIVVEAPGLYLVIENKVDADESDGQCAYYCKHVSHPEARFILLSPDGRRAVGADDFRSLRYSQVAGALADCLQMQVRSFSSPATDGRRAAADYLATLRMEFQ